MNKYTLSNGKILDFGHTMFLEDVVKDLNYLNNKRNEDLDTCCVCDKEIDEDIEECWLCDTCGDSHHPKCSGASHEGTGEHPHEDSWSICKLCVKRSKNDE